MEKTEKRFTATGNLVFVHGTFAQLPSDRGNAWWQIGSDFSECIEKKLRGRASPSSEAFHWSGENSDVFRVFDAAHLLERLCRENEKGPFHVVAHSHGGMVLFHALMLAVEKSKPLENLQSWITVGTPFIFYKPSFRRIAARHILPVILILPLFSMLAQQILGSWLLVALLSIGIIPIFLAYVRYLTKSSSEKLRHLEEETIGKFGSCWTGIRSKHDEAISLLRMAQALKTSVAPQWKGGFMWSYSQEGATKLRGRIPEHVLSRNGPPSGHPANFIHPNSWLKGETHSVLGWRMLARKQVLGMILFWPSYIVRNIMQLGYSRFFAPQLNAAVAGLSKARLLGDDAPYFIASHVTDVPSRSPDLSAAELPSRVDEDLLRQANSNAKEMISDARQNYFSQLALAPTADVFGSWKNVKSDPTRTLVHCLYFERRACQELIAAALLEKCGGAHEVGHKQWLESANAVAQKLVESVSREN